MFSAAQIGIVLFPVLKLLDFIKLLIVELDALDLAFGAVLLQQYNDDFHLIVYSSKKYILIERNYVPHCRVLTKLKYYNLIN